MTILNGATSLKRLKGLRLVGAMIGLSFIASLSFASDSGHSVFEPKFSTKSGTAARWSISIDNDFLAPGGKDKDYTFGLSASYMGGGLVHNPLSGAREAVDHLLGTECNGDKNVSLEVGLYAFTPAELENTSGEDDRPYASLVYASSAVSHINRASKSVYRSQLTIGILGLDLAGNVQNRTHKVTGDPQANGWGRQISDGGEPTFRYSLSKQKLIGDGLGNTELKHTRSVSVGYITEASWGLSFRTGNIHSAWHDFSPEVATYAENSVKVQNKHRESFFWAGISVKARAYNAFFQGQFRNSEVSYNFDDLNHVLVEAWLGYTHSFDNGFYVSYGLRGHTSEMKRGHADRSVYWGGLMIGREII